MQKAHTFSFDRFVLIVTCEHGGNEIPLEYREHFLQHEELLRSHRGFDPGALHMAREIVKRTNAPFHGASVSRLLVELNRSLDNPALWSIATKELSVEDKKKILNQHYHPHRKAVEESIRQCLGDGKKVIHIGIHSFTPERLGEDPRDFDIGILFDPDRLLEQSFCDAWKEAFSIVAPRIRVVYNRPYLGTDDGFTTYLRLQFQQEAYAGIELEINQRNIEEYDQLHSEGRLADGMFPQRLIATIVESLERVFSKK